MRSETDANPPVSFERIVPQAPHGANVDAASRRVSEGSSGVSSSTLGFGLLGLVVLALLAFLVLPGLTTPGPAPGVSTGASVAPPAATIAAAAPAEPTEAPAVDARTAFDDPELLQLRATAQDLQRQFTDESARLAAQGVDRWAAEPFADAAALAQKAASAFAAKDFANANTGYEAALAVTTRLLSEVPQRVAEALNNGLAALDRGDKPAAQTAFELAAALDSGNAAARRGLERVATLDAVRVKLDTAGRLEQAGDETAALAAYRAALALDADTIQARQAIARIEAARTDVQFRRQLGEAIAALDRGEIGVAETRLAQARALRADDPGLRQASARLTEARRAGRLAQMQSDAAAQVASENWEGAVATYRSALEVDPAVAFARAGLAAAEPRAALNTQLQKLIERPERLNSAAVAAEAEALLEQARGFSGGESPRLQEQIAALRRAVDQAGQPVPVRLRSDNQTEVTIYRVGAQGRFATLDIQLKPGRYTAVGTRVGYRDVRREFDVAAGSGASVEVRCEEAL